MKSDQILRISGIQMPLSHTKEQVFRKARRMAGLSSSNVRAEEIFRQSIDARKKENVHYVYSVELTIASGTEYRRSRQVQPVKRKEYHPDADGKQPLHSRIAVVGSGPAGLFCAKLLADNGYRPLLLERGHCVEQRIQDVHEFWTGHPLNMESNVQFGEGGAGTFSDGKLNTMVKDKDGRGRYILQTFIKFGAPRDILYSAHPHIGTDLLTRSVAGIRESIRKAGGTVCFESKVTSVVIANQELKALIINDSQRIDVDAAVFCIGHSARDTFEMLYRLGVPMEPKAFAVGFRIEHPQKMISHSQYGNAYTQLPPAPYKLTHHTKSGRGVYTFCMCPGGYVVNASSEAQALAVNGMSYHGRASANANSAVVLTVGTEDFPNTSSPFGGMMLQRRMEQKAYELGNGAVPQQLFGDFKDSRRSKDYGDFSSCLQGRGSFANLRPILKEEWNQDLIEGIEAFGRKIRGFSRSDAILSGVESRTSSPVRIPRGKELESNVHRLYPCGEGAGYAGGIMSAAMDGLKCAEQLMHRFAQP